MNIKVGEYIRTKQGDIDKVILEYTGKCANPNCSAKHISCELNYYDEEDIVNHSKNIIDLIEVGDYVNGHLVVDVDNINKGAMREIYCEDDEEFGLWNENIKTIVTKQQFSNMEYRI